MKPGQPQGALPELSWISRIGRLPLFLLFAALEVLLAWKSHGSFESFLAWGLLAVPPQGEGVSVRLILGVVLWGFGAAYFFSALRAHRKMHWSLKTFALPPRLPDLGIYQRSRFPLHTAMLLFMFGWITLLRPSIAMLLEFVFFALFLYVYFARPTLRLYQSHFGPEAFEAYLKRTRVWTTWMRLPFKRDRAKREKA